ncbi:MAG: hypothetical protein B6245_19935 [Desulfobacteraceae bacterium 4572_88]|nr:MAG: hypothetical protein B6245_19935 [Desulfobacteraceae bacterium 4572_88]
MGRKKKKKTKKTNRQTKNRILLKETVSDTEAEFQKAVQCHQSGQFQQAADIYEKILEKNPQHSDSLHLFGVLSHQMGQKDVAEGLIRKAIQIRPENSNYHNNLGIVFQGRKELDKAIICYQNALQLNPNFADAHNNLGFSLQDQRRLDEAIACYQKALQLKPGYADAYNNLGTALKDRGRPDEAIASYQKVLELRPNYVEAYNNMGSAFRDQGKYDEAIACYQKALQLKPGYVEAYNNMGTVLKDQGRLGEAIACYQKALKIKPDHAELHNNMGTVLKDMGKLGDAIRCYQNSLHLKSDNFVAYVNLGNVLQDQGKLDEAIACYQKSLEIRPDYTVAYDNMKNAYISQGKVEEAVVCCEKRLEIRPDPGIEVRKALMLPVIYESRDHISHHRKKILQEIESLRSRNIRLEDPNRQVGSSNFHLAYHGLNDRDIQKQLASFYIQACPDLTWEAKPEPRSVKSGTRIRLGIVSVHLYNQHQQTIGKLNRGIIQNLSREKFEVRVFRFSKEENPLIRAINEAADEVIDLPSDLKAAREAIAGQGLDILFYPDIGMDSLTYFLAFSRLAPVQCVTWGHPVTTGIPNMDYFISAEHLEPPDAQAHYSERLVLLRRLPVYYYRPEVPETPLPREKFGLPEDANLYICPQAPFKFHPDFDAALGSILRRDPRGLLVLIEGQTFDHWARLLLKRFRSTFPDTVGRIRFLKAMPTKDFLSLLMIADALLEPPYFGGGNTSYESFACGVPIVTWPGPFMRGRVTLGCYQQMGVLDCVASDAQSYVDIAFRLANDRAWKNQIRDKIRANDDTIFENMEAIRELERFFEKSVKP